jgi:ParB family chromosome partitioning protein
MLHVEHLIPNQQQPRQHFDEEGIAQLAASIKQHGLIQPIVARKSEEIGIDGSALYEIVAGERRWRAAQIAGLTKLETRIVKADNPYAATLALVENTHRSDLSIVEVAQAYTNMLERYGWTQQQLANHVSSTRQQVGHVLSVLKLSDMTLSLLQSGELSLGHAKLLLQLKDAPEAQNQLAQECVRDGMSVRALNEAISQLNPDSKDELDTRDLADQGAAKRRTRSNPNWAPSVAVVEELLDTQARIRGSKGNYILEVRFSDAEDLARIVGVIKKEPAGNNLE